MNQKTESSRNESNPSESPKHPLRRGRRWMLAGMAAIAVGVLSVAGISHADGAPGWQGRHHHMGMAQMDPEMAAKRIDHMINRLLADGTAEQKAAVTAIAKAAMNDLQPLRAQHRAAREQGLQLLTAPTIDRAALEQLRVSQLQLADQASKRISQALADASEVLTPEQRVRLAEHIKQRMAHKSQP